MVFENIITMVKKKGFRDTLTILAQNGHKLAKPVFLNELNKISYYNSFYRVKNDLISKNLISIKETKGEVSIQLTSKGKQLLKKLSELENLILN